MSTEAVLTKPNQRNRLVLVMFALICAAPIIASYLTYFVFKPEKRTNYGTLIEPQRPVPSLVASTLDGQPFNLDRLAGRWVMLSADGGACPTTCATKLYEMRQIRIMTGKDRERLERVWLVTDDAPVPARVINAYEGMLILRVDAAALAAWLPPGEHGSLAGPIYLVDPHQNLMMRFPDAADPYRIKRDISKLLNASEIG